MTVDELREKLATMKDMMEENWLEDDGGMEEFEVHNVYEKTDVFEEVLDLLENAGDELDIAHRLA